MINNNFSASPTSSVVGKRSLKEKWKMKDSTSSVWRPVTSMSAFSRS